MKKHVLVINCGSSSIKYELYDMAAAEARFLGLMEKIGEHRSVWRHEDFTRGIREDVSTSYDFVPNHEVGMERIAKSVEDYKQNHILMDIEVIAHRVVHGGDRFIEATVLNDEVIDAIESMSKFAPLHNKVSIIGIKSMQQNFPDAIHVAVFDTAFHQTLPPHVYHYPLPEEFYEKHQVRRYGFHGVSHQYVTGQAAAYLDKSIESCNLISLHLGNGASIAAIEKGYCVDTSMGMTPLEGLMMGSRCGDIDPAIPLYLQNITGKNTQQIDYMMNHESGLVGVCGYKDMRDVERSMDEGDTKSKLAFDMFCYRIKKYIGAYAAALGHVDAIIFTAGMGEHDARVRSACCNNLSIFGIELDEQRNASAESSQLCEIQTDNSPVKVLVIPTNEAWEIAEQAVARLSSL